ncbi:MAG TPA: hypothetical protein VME92_17990 [Acetobacteraceae bacterium]|nr:hypothetical protein [Acetobacteraceae bacterium]
MTRVLILSHAADIHVSAVEWALRRSGHSPVVWRMDRFPGRQSAALRIPPEGDPTLALEGIADLAGGQEFDTVWSRRMARPTLHPDLHPSDRMIASREARFFLEGTLRLLAPAARWVNPLDGRYRAICKPLQLHAARAAGLAVPDTLIANDPEAIRGFVDRHAGQVVIKPFFPASWQAAERLHTFYATRFDAAVLANEFAVRAAPAIFQPALPREYELRITVMGQTCFAARIDPPPADAPEVIDWKQDLYRRELTPYDLPDAVREGCLGLMRRLGIVFGCIDIIRQPDGTYSFLEVNEMGAFLWVEEYAPSLPLLAAFCDFICDGSADFRWQPRGARPGIWDFRAAPEFAIFEEENDPDLLRQQYQMTVEEVG